MYILVPATAGSVVLMFVATALNNLAGDRSYPTSWLGPQPAKTVPPVVTADTQFARETNI